LLNHQDIYLPQKTITSIEIPSNVLGEEYKILTIPQIAKNTSPAVISIESLNRNGDIIGRTSGFIIDANGLVVTNYHVLGGW